MAETEAKTALKQAGTALQETGTALQPAGTALKNEKVGEVVSTKMQKTIVVEVSRRVPHPLYKRIIGKRKKFYAHDEEGSAKTGDVVLLCHPYHDESAFLHGGIHCGSVRVRCLPIGMASLIPRSRFECYSEAFLFRRLALEPVWAFERAPCQFTQRFQRVCRKACWDASMTGSSSSR